MKYLLTILLLLFTTNVYAKPIITSANNNATININCSSAGTKSQASPLGYWNFEDGLVPNVWTYDGGSIQSDSVSITSSVVRNGNYACEFDIYSYMRSSFSWISGVTEQYKIYTYFTIRKNWEFTPVADDTKYSKIKFMRYYSGAGAIPNCYYEFASDNKVRIIENANSGVTYFSWDINNEFTKDEWHTFETYYEISANGEMYLKMDGSLVQRETGLDFTDADDGILYPMRGGIQPLGSERTGGDSPTDRYWVDDYYIDNTQARVMIGNKPIFENCTHLEIQIPTSWSDTSITVTRNLGTFSEFDDIYLFVIDADGNASDGYYIGKNRVGINFGSNINSLPSKISWSK